MKETPMLFSAPMVLALLAGTKTMTRRIVKPQPEEVGFGKQCEIKPYCTGTDWPMAYYEKRGACWNSSKPLTGMRLGDRIWVRETWRLTTSDDCSCYDPCNCKSGLAPARPRGFVLGFTD